jgi:hypothetical protein
MRTKQILSMLTLALIFVLFQNCGKSFITSTDLASDASVDGTNNNDNLDEDLSEEEETPMTITFDDVYPIILSNCVGCHGSTNPTGLDMTTKELAYANLVGTSGVFSAQLPTTDTEAGVLRVSAGNTLPEASYVIAKIIEDPQFRSAEFNDRMPKGGPYLSSGDIQVFIDWINGGAFRD